jgi:tetratricopeptide (TPR) repeat protein
MNSRTACTFWLTLTLLPMAAAGARALDQEAAAGYLAQARLLAAAGARTQALGLLDTALEYFPGYSEAEYLYGRILLAEQAGTRAGIERLRAALAAGTWAGTDPQRAATELAGALVRTRQFARAREVLAQATAESPAAEPGLGARDNPDAAWLWGLTLAGLGDREGAGRYLDRALQRYPADPRLYLALARSLAVRRQTARALEVLDRGRRGLKNAPELTLEAARLERERNRRLALLEMFVREGGQDPAAAVLALTLKPREAQPWSDRFLAWGGLARLAPLAELRQLYGATGSGAAQLRQAISGFSGTQTLDQDEDGWYEQRCELERGALQSWVLDQDQDGVPEAEVELSAGTPQRLTVGALDYRYSAYPFLSSIAVRADRGRREYTLKPYVVRLELFAGAPPYGSGPLRLLSRSRPTEAEARSLAHQLLEYDGGEVVRRLVLAEGRVQRLEEGRDGRFTRVVEYAGGLPASGRRDLDGDGTFELQERYARGKLTGLSVDQDNDGRPEFRQEFTAGGTRSSWDYNGDGVQDSRETVSGDGTTLREFSTRLDGVFDAAAVFRGEELLEFRRGGRPLAVTQGDGVIWLGRPGGPAQAFRDLPAGLHTVGDARYFVWLSGGRRYVGRL